jgi:hypothetical protein
LRLDARILAKLKAMVVFPTPPFWFVIAMVIIFAQILFY